MSASMDKHYHSNRFTSSFIVFQVALDSRGRYRICCSSSKFRLTRDRIGDDVAGNEWG
jgi:hypothetical protein